MNDSNRCAVCSRCFKQKSDDNKQYVCSNCGNSRLYFILAKGFELKRKVDNEN